MITETFVVTGVGAITPIGNTGEYWEGLLTGRMALADHLV